MSADEASSDEIVSAEVTLPGEPMADTLSYFTDELGFRIDSIFPADAPRVAVISGHGVRLRLDAKFVGDPGVIRLNRRGFTPHEVQTSAPNGTVVEFVADKEVLVLPALAPSLVVQCANDDSSFAAGRAGMEYRDLIPDRYGGRFIASHIRIRKAGQEDRAAPRPRTWWTTATRPPRRACAPCSCWPTCAWAATRKGA